MSRGLCTKQHRHAFVHAQYSPRCHCYQSLMQTSINVGPSGKSEDVSIAVC